MTGKKILLILNPASHGRRAHKKWKRIFSALDEYHIEYEKHVSSSIEDVRDTAANACGFSSVAACGGDGTINACAEGVLMNPLTELKLGVIYTGTSPDFCRFHNIPTDVEEAVRVIAESHFEPVDAPEIIHDGVTEHFFCSCNPGLGADVAEKANRLRPFLGDFAGTLLAFALSVLRNRKYTYFVNGRRYAFCRHLLITQMPYIAGGLAIPFNPQAVAEDEVSPPLCLWHISGVSLFRFLLMIRRFYSGSECGHAEMMSCREISIESEKPLRLEFDGDVRGTLPCLIRRGGKKLNLIKEARK